MDPVTAAFIFIMGLAIGEENKKQDVLIDDQNMEIYALQQQVEDLEDILYRLAGAHASLSANNKIDDEDMAAEIQYLQERLEYLQNRVDIYHD